MFDKQRKLEPVSRKFGYDLGTPIDRYYIESFLKQNMSNIYGRVLEVADSNYSEKFGSQHVTQLDVLAREKINKTITIVGDLETGEGLPQKAFDCIILTQTLNVIYHTRAAIENLYKMLQKKGSLLVTVPGISQISRYDMDCWGDYWRFTTLSIKRLFSEVFLEQNIFVESYGNVYTSSAFLYGIPVENLTTDELDYRDPDYEMLISIRAFRD